MKKAVTSMDAKCVLFSMVNQMTNDAPAVSTQEKRIFVHSMMHQSKIYADQTFPGLHCREEESVNNLSVRLKHTTRELSFIISSE